VPSRGSRALKPLAILLGVFVMLALFYSVSIPLFEGPDEDDHFRYAKFIADHRALPVQLFEPGGGSAGHQGWQPPLYYSLAALVIAPIDKSDHEQRLWRNYAVTFVGDPACCGRNIYYHTAAEQFPYTRTTLAVHLARLISILFGAVTVAASFEITKTVLSASQRAIGIAKHTCTCGNRRCKCPVRNERLAIAAAAIVAFNPSFLFASALVSNDAMLAAISSLVLLMWVRLLAGQSAPAARSAAILGVLIGLGVLTKTTALGLIPFSMLVLILVAWRQCDVRGAIVGSAAMLALIALVSGGWFIRNQILYGDPLAYRLMITSAIFPRAGPLTLDELVQISLPWLWQTFWGGPTPGDFAPAILIALGALTLVAFVGAVLLVIRNWKLGTRRGACLLVLGAWLGFILVAQIQFIRTTTGADQGRYLFPAISVIALVFVLGLNELGRGIIRILNGELRTADSEFVIGASVIGSFFALALFVPFAYTLPAYARPALLSSNDLTRIAKHPVGMAYSVNVAFADQFQLLGYELDTRSVKPGDTLRVALYWRAHAPMDESYRVFVHLIGQANRSAGGVDVIPARGAFPTVYWNPGDILRDVVSIPVALDAPPGKYEIEVGAYPVGKPGERLLTGTGDDRVLIAAIKIAPRETAPGQSPRTRIDANFAHQIELIGYDLNPNPDVLQLTLYWRARAVPERDYTVFIHALDANGQIITQVDQPPQNGNYPTSLWDAGEQIRDDYTLTMPAGTLPQRVIVGLYRADTGERLRVGVSDHVQVILRGAGQ
jgi:hypothetical protein